MLYISSMLCPVPPDWSVHGKSFHICSFTYVGNYLTGVCLQGDWTKPSWGIEVPPHESVSQRFQRRSILLRLFNQSNWSKQRCQTWNSILYIDFHSQHQHQHQPNQSYNEHFIFFISFRRTTEAILPYVKERVKTGALMVCAYDAY